MVFDTLNLDEIDEFRKQALIARSREFSPSGFLAFFELYHVIPLHSEGRRWATEVFLAHLDGLGYMNKAHRESAKSTFAKFFLCFYVGHHPEKSSMIIRKNDDKANETTQSIANIIEYDPRWPLCFPHVEPDKQKGWGATGYEVMRNDIKYEEWTEIKTALLPDPSFVGYGYKSGSILGSRINGVALVDDILDLVNTSSVRLQNWVKIWHSEVFDPVLQEGAFEIWNYTPWLETDLYANLEATGTYMVSVTPLLVRVTEETPGAELWPPHPQIPISGQWYLRYWPEAWPWERINKKFLRGTGDEDSSGGYVAFMRMYMLDLEAIKGLNLKDEWLHKYPAVDIDPSWPTYFGVDYASTADKLKAGRRDYFAMAIAKGIPGGGIVVIDGVQTKCSKAEALQIVLSHMAIYPNVQIIGVENIGKGEEFYNDLLLAKDMAGRIPPLMPISHGRKSKGDRFENWLAPRCQTARIWFSNVQTAFLRTLYAEWLAWPNGTNDDCIDGVYMVAMAAEGRLGIQQRTPDPEEKLPRILREERDTKTSRWKNPYDSIRS